MFYLVLCCHWLHNIKSIYITLETNSCLLIMVCFEHETNFRNNRWSNLGKIVITIMNYEGSNEEKDGIQHMMWSWWTLTNAFAYRKVVKRACKQSFIYNNTFPLQFVKYNNIFFIVWKAVSSIITSVLLENTVFRSIHRQSEWQKR